ncbi:hypothetical protein V8E51_002728 [Hyaloscypha variabilis]
MLASRRQMPEPAYPILLGETRTNIEDSSRQSVHALDPENINRAKQPLPPEWLENFPYVKRLLAPYGYDQEVDGRGYKLCQAREELRAWIYFYGYSPKTKAFFGLIDALERDRELSISFYENRITTIQTALRLAKEDASLRVMTEHDLPESPGTEALESDIPARTIPELLSSSDISIAHELEQPNCPTTMQLVQPQRQTEEITSGPRVKDLSKFKFKCDKCEKSYTRSTTLQEHKRSHNNERRWACQLCPRRFVRLKDRNRHQTIQHAQKTIECGLSFQLHSMKWKWGCHQRFAREDGLVSHLRTAKGRRCLKSLMDDDTSMTFFQLTPAFNDKTELECSVTSDACQKRFNDLQQLYQHLNGPNGKKCAMSWLIHHIFEIYRGNSHISVVPLRGEQSSATTSMNRPDDGSDEDDANGDQETSISLEPCKEPAAYHDEPEELTLGDTDHDIDTRIQRLSANVAGLQHSLSNNETKEASSISDPPDTDPRLKESLCAGWTIMEQPDVQTLQPGKEFWITIKCTTRSEAEYIFWFTAGVLTEGAFATPVPLSKDSNLYKLSGLIPRWLESYADGKIHLKVYPRGSPEAYFFDLGFLRKSTMVVTKE